MNKASPTEQQADSHLQASVDMSMPGEATGQSFPTLAERQLQNLRGSVQSIVEQLPQRPTGATSLAESMSLQFGLSRKLWRFIEDKDIFVAGQNVPGKLGFKLFLEAADAKGIDSTNIEECQVRVQDFAGFVELQAGDRNTFDIMLATHAQTQDKRTELNQRRQAFRSSGYMLGVHCEAVYCRYIIAPSQADPLKVDIAATYGCINLKRLRPDAPWRLSRGSRVDDTGEPTNMIARREPLFPLPDDIDPQRIADLPLLADYSSKPIPRIERIPGRPEHFGYQLASGPAGMQGVITCMIGEAYIAQQNRYITGSPYDMDFHWRTALRTPAESAVLELFIHDDLLYGQEPAGTLYSDMFDQYSIERKLPSDRLYVHEQTQHFDRYDKIPAIKRVPQYHDLTDRTFNRMNWDTSQFSFHRMEIAYPPIPSAMYMSYGGIAQPENNHQNNS